MIFCFQLKPGQCQRSQTEIAKAVRSLGADVIQTGSELCVRAKRNHVDVLDELAHQGLRGLKAAAINSSWKLSPNVAAFYRG